jgi:hypothetical protein
MASPSVRKPAGGAQGIFGGLLERGLSLPGLWHRSPDAGVSLELSRVSISAFADFAISGLGTLSVRYGGRWSLKQVFWIARKRL